MYSPWRENFQFLRKADALPNHNHGYTWKWPFLYLKVLFPLLVASSPISVSFASWKKAQRTLYLHHFMNASSVQEGAMGFLLQVRVIEAEKNKKTRNWRKSKGQWGERSRLIRGGLLGSREYGMGGSYDHGGLKSWLGSGAHWKGTHKVGTAGVPLLPLCHYPVPDSVPGSSPSLFLRWGAQLFWATEWEVA